jgi:hypothetical protein
MQEILPIFDRCLPPSERRALQRKRPRKRGHAMPPGTGPTGETCGSCYFLVHKRLAKTYLKCELRRATWTGGGGTDVRARDPACSKWEAGKGEAGWEAEQKRRRASLESQNPP